MAPAAAPQRIVVLCTVESGVDTVAELVRRGIRPAALVGLHPDAVDPDKVSGWLDVAPVAARLGIPHVHVGGYGLGEQADRAALEALRPELVLITGWQRLVPEWLIEAAPFGVIGCHGSPDGISGGRGRSPQNWALLLGCRSFELALFRVTAGVDDGPVLATRRFAYSPDDDIGVSYKRVSLATASMIEEVLADPARLQGGTPQAGRAHYYPQRKPEDGWADWALPAAEVARHCRALTRPYPGLRTRGGETEILLWRCQPFDDDVTAEPGTVAACFQDGAFLVHALDGRLLVRDWSADGPWRPSPGDRLEGRSWTAQLANIVARHRRRHPDFPVSPRILRLLEGAAP